MEQCHRTSSRRNVTCRTHFQLSDMSKVQVDFFFQFAIKKTLQAYFPVINVFSKQNDIKNWKNIVVLSKSESVKFSLIESVICLFTDSSVEKIFFTVKSVNFH